MNRAPAVARRWLESLRGPLTQNDRNEGGRRALARAACVRLLEPLEPRPWALRRPSPVPPYVTVSVYRARNAATVEALVAGSSGDASLWALDDPVPGLAEQTVGSGPGVRFVLLNRLVAAARVPPAAWVVISDDDVLLKRGSLDDLVRIAAASGFDLAQPAHDRRSYINWGSTLHELGSTARTTRYVEQGPLLVIGPKARSTVLPFPENLGMGWGIEALWAAKIDLRIGIVDAVLARHLHPVGRASYDVAEQWTQAERLLRESGFHSWREIQAITSRWASWRRAPDWTDVGVA